MASPDALWQAAFGDAEQPQLYKSSSDDDGFAPINNPKLFVRELDNLSQQQLYATTANNRIALKLAQDEYLDLDKILRRIEEKEPLPNPQALLDPERFEEEKEAVLYGYKYRPDMPTPYTALDRKKFPGEEQDVRKYNGFQDPWKQGGFVPSDGQYRRMKASATDPRNIDGFVPVAKDGKILVPRMNRTPPPYIIRRKRKAVEIEPEEISRPGTSSSTDSLTTPSKAINKRLTRYRGNKHPPTRDVSEAPSAAATPRGRRQDTPQIKSTTVTPAPTGSSTPKRRKPNPTQIALPNQNRTNRIAPIDDGTSAAEPGDLLHKKWTGDALIAAVKRDHSWLNPDPEKALVWKEKILESKFPVRTLSMFKKWAFWKENEQDKRPRKMKGGKDGDDPSALAEVDRESSEDPLQRKSAGAATQQEGRTEGAAHKLDEDDTEDEDELAIKKQIEGQLREPEAGQEAQGSPQMRESLETQPSQETKGSAGRSSNSSTPSRRSTRKSRRVSG